MGCGCNGMGAYFKDRVIMSDRASSTGRAARAAGFARAGVPPEIRAARAASVTRAGRVVGTDRFGRAIATDGFGAYYLAVPGQMFSGFGAAPAFQFDAAGAWSDWVAGRCANEADYSNNQAMCTIRGKRAVNSIRAALGELGFGVSVMSVSWGPEDQAKYKEWAVASGQVSANGMPESAHLQLMQQQISQGMVVGSQQPVSYSVVGGQIVETAAAYLQKAKGLGWKTWALIGGGLLLVGGLIYMKKHKKPVYTSYHKTTAIEPYRGPAMVPVTATANRRHRKTRKNGRKGCRSWR